VFRRTDDPILAIGEVTYLLGARVGSSVELRFLADVIGGNYTPMTVEPDDWIRIAELTRAYADLPLGTADASLVALAERLRITQVATLDRKHFSVVRPLHAEALELLP
jgi:predicted nucleic acid-binding protein